jgi:hypothetical protein
MNEEVPLCHQRPTRLAAPGHGDIARITPSKELLIRTPPDSASIIIRRAQLILGILLGERRSVNKKGP